MNVFDEFDKKLREQGRSITKLFADLDKAANTLKAVEESTLFGESEASLSYRLKAPTVILERWDDPGDYPSGAGGGPLPSRHYLALDDPGALKIDLEQIKDALWDGANTPLAYTQEDEDSLADLEKKLYVTWDLLEGELVFSLEQIVPDTSHMVEG